MSMSLEIKTGSGSAPRRRPSSSILSPANIFAMQGLRQACACSTSAVAAATLLFWRATLSAIKAKLLGSTDRQLRARRLNRASSGLGSAMLPFASAPPEETIFEGLFDAVVGRYVLMFD